MSSRWRRLSIALLLGAAAVWLAAPDAAAHAAYESSSPAFGAVLSDSPAQISIRFTQELFRREGANGIRLEHVDSGRAAAVGAALITNAERRRMTVDVAAPLAPGRYLVAWTNLSAEDGDADTGAYPFYVLREPTAAEAQADRELANELLIVYPGDEDEDAEAETSPAPPPTVVLSEVEGAPGLGAGPIAFLSVGAAAGLLLIVGMGYRLASARRRGGGETW